MVSWNDPGGEWDTGRWAGWQKPGRPGEEGAHGQWAGPMARDSPGAWPALPQRQLAHALRAPRLTPGLLIWLALLLAFLLAGTVAAVAILGTGKAPGATRSPSPAGASVLTPAVSLPGARDVVAAFAAANNKANRSRSNQELAAIEAGSSYLLDAGQYQWMRSIDPGNGYYTPYAVQDPAYYIPLLPRSAYPRWFAVQVNWLATAGPEPGPHGPAYIVFNQATPGSGWRDVLEPNLIAATDAPQVTLDTAGFATAVDAQGSGDGLAAPPAMLPSMTAAVLNGAGSAVAFPGTLGDVVNAAHWRSTLPAGSTVDEAHSPAQTVYALRTAGGGALVLYAGSATLRLAPPAGQALSITIPGFYPPGRAESSAQLRFTEQFAVADPPLGHGQPQVIADASGLNPTTQSP
jgi:hypothetical protein